ncbi:MAG: hypothetical protein FJ363_04855 [Gemmatimonadetes bacterium]|nr:hypothetical protein [Gemmatimonadota bacterium]
MRRLLLSLLLGAAVTAPLAAQGALSLQGFGYPTGQLSTRAAATAGAFAETDAGSPINPAALPGAGRSIFAFQVDPEYRRVTVGGRDVNTKTARFPVVSVGTRTGARGFLGISFSSVLDRTWDASFRDTVVVSGANVGSRVSTQVRGAMNDARVAYAWTFSERLQAGVAFHAYSGANRMNLSRTFDDTTTYGALVQNMTLSYAGSSLSAGLVSRPVTHLYVAASLKLGGAMKTRYADSVATHGNAPHRFGLSVTYDGIPGSQLTARFSKETWSRMQSLGSSQLDARDATDISVGAELAGPRFRSTTTLVRLGGRTRGLPFAYLGDAVRENTLAIGGGATFARGWATLDVSLQRNDRSGGGLKELGNILSVGLTVRP